ncbi:MAG: hypothetical protein ABR543_04495 [Gemmatimonadaceae bacterium]
MDSNDIVVRLRELKHGGSASSEMRRWPLSTLAAYLFDGRECDEVRALLAGGTGTAHDCEVSWPPLSLSAEEMSAIERDFPQSDPPSSLELGRASLVELHCPALRPVLIVPLRAGNPQIEKMAERASYLRFDYGHWADVYVATLTQAEAAEILAHPARRLGDAGAAELAARVVGEDDAALYFIVPRRGVLPPWTVEP